MEGLDKKISISIPHFYCMEYREGKKRLIIDIDFRESEMVIGKSLIKNGSRHINQ